MEVTVYGQLRSATGEKAVDVDFEGGPVRDALDAFVAAYPRAERHLLDEDGALAPSVRITVDGTSAALDDACPGDASFIVHPAMQGG